MTDAVPGKRNEHVRAPTIIEVARHARAGVASVSRVLSGHPDVSSAMRARVLAAVEELGYEPNMQAQGLRRHETSTIGFLLSNISNHLLAEIVQGAEGALRATPYSMVLTDAEGDPALGAQHLRVLKQRRVDGLLVITANERDSATTVLLESLTQPIVVIDRELSPRVRATYVLSDHSLGLTAAIEDLISLGHERIALIVGTRERPSRVRQQVFADVMTRQGLSPSGMVRQGALTPSYGQSALAELLDQAAPPTAVILGGNQLLEGALAEIHRRGVDLGSALSVVSCDDTPLTRLHRPSVSVIARDARGLGRVAAETLLRRLAGEDVDDTVLETTYRSRESSGECPSKI